ncbi:NF038143 family protein [bacterium]|nr:NF038143 family protein [bacterium]
MLDLQNKRKLLRSQELKTAQTIAAQVIEKPKLSVWMILIPIVFIYYFYSFHRYSTGRKDFVKSFIKTRSLILDEAYTFIESGEKPDFLVLAQEDNVPENAVGAYKNWAQVLFEHYVKLLGSEGDSYPSLVKARYKEQGTYLLILDQINKAESLFYKALRKNLKDSVDDVAEMIKKIEESLGRLRREEARLVFTS